MATRLTLRTALGVAGTVAVLLLAGCGGNAGPRTVPVTDHGTPAAAPTTDAPVVVTKPVKLNPPEPLRQGETRKTVRIPRPYTPKAPNGVGTDDYRCFLLDPHLTQDTFLTGTYVQPDLQREVHHVILYRAEPDQIAEAKHLDAADPGEGWTCFGSSGLSGGFGLSNSGWLGAWAPGGKESVDGPGFGTPLAKGTRIIMQVHYNLLAGPGPDRSATLLRLAPAGADLTPLSTMLFPAPVELPCRPQHADGPLCSRPAAIADAVARFGNVGQTNNWLYLLCGGGQPVPSETTSCTRPVQEPTTIRAVAGHMHLLGRSIKVEVNPGTPRAKTVLDIPVWDFDNQMSHPIKPVTLLPGDTVKVTCKHVQWLRDKLPAFASQRQDKYVVWGEGSTDEMCLGILVVTHP